MFHRNRVEISAERKRYLQKMRVEKYGINAALIAGYIREKLEKTDFYSFTEDDFKLIDYKYTKLDHKIPVAV